MFCCEHSDTGGGQLATREKKFDSDDISPLWGEGKFQQFGSNQLDEILHCGWAWLSLVSIRLVS